MRINLIKNLIINFLYVLIICAGTNLLCSSNVIFAVESPANSLKIGIVKAKELENCLYFQNINKKLEKEFNGKTSKLNAKKSEFKNNIDLFERNKAIWSEKERRSKENELAKLDQEVQHLFETIDADFKSRHQEELITFHNMLENVLKDFTKQEHYALIILDQFVLYYDQTLDCTQKVITILNNQFKAKK